MLSYKNILLIIIATVLIASCKKNPMDLATISSFGVQADSMNLTHDTASYSLGSKSTFKFTGNPVAVTFYSGETGHRYIYRNRVSATGITKLIFTNALNAGTQANSLHVMLSSDFKGVASSFAVVNGVTTNTLVNDTAATQANIAAATWTDITPLNLATNATAVTDTLDLTTYAAAGKKVYIAFKYIAQAGSIQNKWTITNLGLTNNLADNTTYTIANLGASNTPITNYGVSTLFSPGWVAYNVANNYTWAITAGTSLVITGATTAAAATSNAEAWTFIGSIDLTKVAPDMGVAVKDMTVAPMPFQFTYAAKGKYDAVFAATNLTVYTTDSIVRKIPVVIQ